MKRIGIKRIAAFALLALGIAAVWYIVGIRNGVSYWNADDDYAYLSLAHALSFEQLLRGETPLDLGLSNHPGIPYYLASWIAFKLAVPVSASGFIQVLSGATDLEGFWLVSRAIAAILAIGGVMLIFRTVAAKPVVLTATAAALLFLAGSPQAWIAITRLGIESFALAYAMLFYIAAKNAFTPARRGLVAWFIFGLAGGLGYTLKFNYLAFAVASIAGLAAMLAVGGCRPSKALTLGAAYTAGFLFAFGLLALVFMGSYSTLWLIKFHIEVALHSGHYGEGDATVVSPTLLLIALRRLALTPAPVLALTLAVVAAAYVMLTRWRDHAWRSSAFPLGVSLVAALLISLSAALKHFQPHYLLVPLSVVPPLLLYIVENAPSAELGRRFALLAGTLGLALLPFTIFEFNHDQIAKHAVAAQVTRDAASIEARPLEPNEIRVWDYRVPTRGFAAGFIVEYAGSPAISEWYQRASMRDRYVKSLPYRNWRYAVLRTNRYANEELVRTGWSGYLPGDRIEMLSEMILVERLSRGEP